MPATPRFALDAALILSSLLASAQVPNGLVARDRPMPPFTITSADGKRNTNATCKGKPSVICVIGDSAMVPVARSAEALRKSFGKVAQVLVLDLSRVHDKSPLPVYTIVIDKDGIVRNTLSGQSGEATDPATKEDWWTLYATRELNKLLGKRSAIEQRAASMDREIAKDPSLESKLFMNKFLALAAYSTPASSGYARKLQSGLFAEDGKGLNAFAEQMIRQDGPLRNPDLTLVAEMGYHSSQICDADIDRAHALDIAGRAYFLAKQIPSAIRVEQMAVEAAQSAGASDKAKEYKDRLELFKKAKR